MALDVRNITNQGGAASGFIEALMAAIQKKQDEAQKMRLMQSQGAITQQNAMAVAQQGQQFDQQNAAQANAYKQQETAADPERQIKTKLFGLAEADAQPRYGSGMIGPATATQDMDSGRRQQEIDTLLRILNPRSQMQMLNPAVTFDGETGQYFDQSGNPVTEIRKGTTVRNKFSSDERAESQSAARARGTINERGLSGETAGRLASADQGARLAMTAKSILFPNGTAQSFRRDIAIKLQDPTGAALVGDQEAQDVQFQLEKAIDAQLFMQSGAATRPDELKRLARQYMKNALADPDDALMRVNELSNVLNTGRGAMDPKRRFTNKDGSAQGASGRIKVRRSDGKTGTIDASDFDPNKYQRLQ